MRTFPGPKTYASHLRFKLLIYNPVVLFLLDGLYLNQLLCIVVYLFFFNCGLNICIEEVLLDEA